MVAGEEPVLLHPSHRARNRKGMKQNFSPPLQGRSNRDTAMRSAHLSLQGLQVFPFHAQRAAKTCRKGRNESHRG